jgi:hypothetical protein
MSADLLDLHRGRLAAAVAGAGLDADQDGSRPCAAWSARRT